ncbi:hypothetical protein FHX52_3852 [Humibacillus xanthopallidus]|uniref:Secreted protein n=1 Tax=Humibacillus xanthopallidus TaxID=412689 RepID=A0A543PKN2_9MICO|nr:hypothetical protein [Humibacillus xanthopallidus]TQN44636.1 hypothetical protein FHX52_3852 [Humibacillus xanthopallidus]
MRQLHRRSVVAAVVLVLFQMSTPSSAMADAPTPVDESRLVPALSPSFEPWSCQTKQEGPVCKGERHTSSGWVPFDLACGDTQLWANGTSDRFQTRYYNKDYLDTYREFRTNDIDQLSTSPTGPATATISTNVRFSEPFAVPGDDQTRTITTEGVLWDIRSSQGAAVWRAVGRLVEPPDAVGTFSGHVTAAGKTTRFVDAPLPEVLSDETFVSAVCAAVTGSK